jgi:hypothetical protein
MISLTRYGCDSGWTVRPYAEERQQALEQAGADVDLVPVTYSHPDWVDPKMIPIEDDDLSASTSIFEQSLG